MLLGRSRRSGGEDDGLEVDLSPLIDVTFLLLIFFVLTTSFNQESQLEIRRPAASSASQVEGEPLRIALDSEGVIYIDARRVTPWLVQGRVEALLGTRQNDEVLLIADERAPSGAMIELVDQCRLAGATHVAVSTQGAP